MDASKKQKARDIFAGQAAILEACGPFDDAQTILHFFGEKERFKPCKNHPVFTRNEELRVSLGNDHVRHEIGYIVENSTTDFLCIKDHVIPMVDRLLSVETFAKEIQECVDNGNFDDNPKVKAEFEILVQFLLGGCHKVGKLLCEHLDAIQSQKETLLANAENSIGAEISQIQQQMQQIDDTAKAPNNLGVFFQVATAVAKSVKIELPALQDKNLSLIEKWLPLLEAQQSLNAKIADLGLDQLPALAEQERVLGEELLAIKDSFQQIPNLQNQLQELVDRTEDISEDKLAELEVTRQALLGNTNTSAADSTTSDTPETTQQTGWSFQLFFNKLLGQGGNTPS
jgi:hypothetical protein